MYTLSRKKALHTSRYAKKLEMRRKALYWIVSLLLLCILTSTVVILRTSYLKIDSISVVGASSEKNIQIKSQLEKIALENYLYLIPKGTTFTFPSKSVAEEILSHEPSISSLMINKKGLKNLIVTVEPREPVAISCPYELVTKVNTVSDILANQPVAASTTIDLLPVEIDIPSDQTDDESSESTASQVCRFLDKYAFAYSQAPSYSPGVYVTFYATNTSAFGTHIADTKTYEEFLKFNEEIKLYGGRVANVFFESGDEYEVQAIFSQASSTVKIFFNNRVPLKLAMDRVIKLIDSKYMGNKTNPAVIPGLWRLEYVDGRYGQTVYYKYR